MAKNDKILFEVKEHIGTISNNQNGWDKELNIISWNGQSTPKFDIRAWNEDHTHMARGITLFSDEMQALVELYSEWKKSRGKQSSKSEGKGKEDKLSSEDEGIPFIDMSNRQGKDNQATIS